MISTLLRTLISTLASHRKLALENLALRQQIAVLQRSVKRPRLKKSDRLFWALLSRIWTDWAETLTIVKPETDRDSKYCEAFRTLLEDAGAEPVRLPPRSPNLNAFAERFLRSTKSECINRMIFFSERSLRRAISHFAEHHHTERNHQGLGNTLIEPEDGVGERFGDIACRERLGGVLRYYYRTAA